MHGRSLRVNVVWALSGNAVSAFSSWLMLVVLAKLATAETAGVLGIAQAINIPICALLSMKLQQVQITDVRGEYSFGEYFALKMLAAAAMFVCITGAAFGFYSGETVVVAMVMGVGYAIVELREMFLAVIQKAERMDRISISRAMLGVGSLALFTVCFWASRSLVAGLLGMLAGRLLVLGLYDLPFVRKLLAAGGGEHGAVGVAPQWHWARLWRLAKVAAPLGLTAGVGMLFFSIPRLTLARCCGTEAVGHYTFVSSLIEVGVLLMGAIGQTVCPRLARYFDENRRAFRLLVAKTVVLALAIGGSAILVSAVCGRFVLTLLFNREYGEHQGLLVVLMIAGTVLYVFSTMNVALTAARQFGVQLPIYALAALACGISSQLLVPRLGLNGAAWSLLVCYGIGTFGCVVALLVASCRVPVRGSTPQVVPDVPAEPGSAVDV